MAKKKASKKKTRRASKVRKGTRRKKTMRAAGRKSVRKAAKKSTRKKTIKKRGVKKAAGKRAVRKAAAVPVRKVAKPKRPRRTMQAAPPPAPPPRPVTELEPRPPQAAPPPPQAAAAPRLSVGDWAPDFDLPDEVGRRHSLLQYRGRKVVLYFYPKDDTPGCTSEACGFRDSLGMFTDRNVVVLGVSPDSSASHERFKQKYGLTFPLLADEDHQVAQKYGVWVDKGGGRMGIARTTFIIDADGRVAHVFPNVRPEGHAQEVLGRL